MIVSATTSDAKLLTEIAVQSKGFWGYSKELLSSWKEELTVTETIISKMIVFKYLINNQIIGFYILQIINPQKAELEFLFIAPKFIGKGIGSQLLKHATIKANELKIVSLFVLSDPNAVAFYKNNGFVTVAKKQSTIAGRFLPVMQKDLA